MSDTHTLTDTPILGTHKADKLPLTSAFRSLRQHLEDAHGVVALVDAAVLHLLDVGQGVEGAAEVGFPRLGVRCLALCVFPCNIGEGGGIFTLGSLGPSNVCRCVCFFFFVFLAHVLTCVDGPLLEETGVLLQVPAVTGCVLPRNGKDGLILEDTRQA